jgi:hypothetical protein
MLNGELLGVVKQLKRIADSLEELNNKLERK